MGQLAFQCCSIQKNIFFFIIHSDMKLSPKSYKALKLCWRASILTWRVWQQGVKAGCPKRNEKVLYFCKLYEAMDLESLTRNKQIHRYPEREKTDQNRCDFQLP